MRHLLSIDDLSAEEVRQLVEQSLVFSRESASGEKLIKSNLRSVGLVFAEPSTRTRVSFERACYLLGKHSVLMGAVDSSLTKNESLEDTFENLCSLGCDTLVARLPDGIDVSRLASFSSCPIVNAGLGKDEHPTQALLDVATLYEHAAGCDWGRLKQLKIVISGDLLRSRVAGSWAKLGAKLGLNIVWNAPEAWRRQSAESLAGDFVEDRDEALENVDVWMALRVQKERISSSDRDGLEAKLEEYRRSFQVNQEMLASKGAFLMHPGPVNWGIELNEDLRDYEKSLILEQVRIGVAMRAVILKFLSDQQQI